MVVILYPKDDFDAAQIAFQIQMMLGPGRVFVIPKGWTDDRVVEKLQQANFVLLIITDRRVPLDEMTRRELEVAKALGKRIVIVAPKGKVQRQGWFDLYEFDPSDEEDLARKLDDILRKGRTVKATPQVQSARKPAGLDGKSKAVLYAYFLVMILILSYLAKD